MVDSRNSRQPSSLPTIYLLSTIYYLLASRRRAMTTPMMQQHREAKERYPDMLLLFRAGDFYELFFEDAEVVSRVLGLALTTRDGKAPMAGFPHHALESHLKRLLRAGHRVAICDQVEDA